MSAMSSQVAWRTHCYQIFKNICQFPVSIETTKRQEVMDVKIDGITTAVNTFSIISNDRARALNLPVRPVVFLSTESFTKSVTFSRTVDARPRSLESEHFSAISACLRYITVVGTTLTRTELGFLILGASKHFVASRAYLVKVIAFIARATRRAGGGAINPRSAGFSRKILATGGAGGFGSLTGVVAGGGAEPAGTIRSTMKYGATLITGIVHTCYIITEQRQ